MYQFVPIRDFPLSWRWLNKEYAALPEDVLVKIRPLSAQSAKLVTDQVSEICCKDVPGIRIEANDIAALKLAQLDIQDSEEIFVSWSSEMVVVTIWDVFLKYWDDFCYASSDDVTIWPMTNRWLLCYFHYQLFVYRANIKTGSSLDIGHDCRTDGTG